MVRSDFSPMPGNPRCRQGPTPPCAGAARFECGSLLPLSAPASSLAENCARAGNVRIHWVLSGLLESLRACSRRKFPRAISWEGKRQRAAALKASLRLSARKRFSAACEAPNECRPSMPELTLRPLAPSHPSKSFKRGPSPERDRVPVDQRYCAWR
jgi:hypothetical protein